MKTHIFLILCAAVLLTPMTLYALEDTKVTVKGFGDNREEAVLNAKREAVSKGVGVLLTSETEVKNFMLKKDTVLTKIMGSVKKLTVLDEGTDADGVYFVRVEAVVSEESIKKDLMAMQILLSSLNYPRMLVLFANDQNQQAATTVTDYLLNKGFPVVDPLTVMGNSGLDDAQLTALANGAPGSVAKIGLNNGADFVVLGSVQTSPVDSALMGQTGLASARASLVSRVISSKSGRILASKTAGASAAHLSEGSAKANAATKAAEKLMDEKLFEQLVDAFQNSVNNGFPLQVRVTNVNSYGLQKEIRALIQDMDTISLHKKGFSNKQLDLAVVYKNNGDQFCDAIDGKKVGDSVISITECTGDVIVIELRHN